MPQSSWSPTCGSRGHRDRRAGCSCCPERRPPFRRMPSRLSRSRPPPRTRWPVNGPRNSGTSFACEPPSWSTTPSYAGLIEPGVVDVTHGSARTGQRYDLKQRFFGYPGRTLPEAGGRCRQGECPNSRHRQDNGKCVPSDPTSTPRSGESSRPRNPSGSRMGVPGSSTRITVGQSLMRRLRVNEESSQEGVRRGRFTAAQRALRLSLRLPAVPNVERIADEDAANLDIQQDHPEGPRPTQSEHAVEHHGSCLYRPHSCFSMNIVVVVSTRVAGMTSPRATVGVPSQPG